MPGNLPHHMHLLDLVCVYWYFRLCPISLLFCLRVLRINTTFILWSARSVARNDF